MERLTDLTTVFCGFGIFNANAAKIFERTRRSWSVSAIGYLSERAFGYALAVFAWERGEVPPVWARELKPNPRATLTAALNLFREESRPRS